jgi:programmed cell death 6-interacting protein
MAAPCWIQLPIKRAHPVGFAAPLAKFVADEYQQDPALLKQAVQELTELRDACVVRPAEKHESGLNAIHKYYGRLLALSQRFPFATSEPWNGTLPAPIGLKFAWDDEFAPTGLFARSKTVGTCVCVCVCGGGCFAHTNTRTRTHARAHKQAHAHWWCVMVV